MISGAGVHPRGKHRRAYIVQLVGMHRHREAGLLRRTEEWTNVVHIEHTFLHERIDRLCEVPVDDRRDRVRRVADEPLAIVGVRRRQRVRGEIRDGDIDRGIGLRACEEAELAQLLVRFQAVAALHLDGRRAELHRVADAPPKEREQLLVGRLARRADRGVDPTAGREHRKVVGAAAPTRELFPSFAGVAEMRVRVDEARHHHSAMDIDVDRVFHTLDRLERSAVTGRDDRAIACRDEPVHHRTDVARGRANARTLLPQRRQREEARAVKDEVRRGHSRKWLSMTRSRVNASSLSESAATCRTASSGIRPMSSPRRTVTPAALARVSTSRHTVARDVTVWSSRFIETWTRGGSVSVKPFACTAGRPPDDSRISLAIRCASFRSVESSSMLNAMRNGRAPTTMAPAVGCIRFGPASGTCVVSRSAARPSYSGLRMSGRRTRSGLVAAFAYKYTGTWCRVATSR